MGVSFLFFSFKNKPGQVLLEKGRGLARGRRYLRGAESSGTEPFFAGRERKTRAHTHGDILRVMNMIIGQGTVSLCGSERAGRVGEGEGRERGGWGGERRGEERKSEEKRGEEKRGEKRRREESRREERRGGKKRRGAKRSEAEREQADPARALLRRSAFPGCNGVLFQSAPSAEGSAPQQDLL